LSDGVAVQVEVTQVVPLYLVLSDIVAVELCEVVLIQLKALEIF
jgi:hypothetical protein